MDPLGLTPAERQIADALADGRTVQQIAAASRRVVPTIYWHLSRIYSKLGINRQVDLVRMVLTTAGLPLPRA